MKYKPQPPKKPRQHSLQSFAGFAREACLCGEGTELAVPKIVKGTEKVLKCQFTSSDRKFFNTQGLGTHMKCIHGIASSKTINKLISPTTTTAPTTATTNQFTKVSSDGFADS